MASTTDRNKDALKAVLQLDLSGLEELIAMISQSKDPVMNTNPAAKYEQITLCIIAMADLDPAYALDYVMNAEQEIDPKVYRDYGTSYWLQYILTRLGDRDPERALNTLVELAEDRAEQWGDDVVLTILAKLARQDPSLVLDAVDRLPETKNQYFLESLTFQMHSDDEHTAHFRALRDHYRSRPASMKFGLASLFRRFGNGRESPAELREWVEGLGMTDSEKFLVFDSLDNIDISYANAEEYTKWFATFMPESNERKRLMLKAWQYWRKTDAKNALGFLGEQNIDLHEMIRFGLDED